MGERSVPKTNVFDTAARRIPIVRRSHSLNIYPTLLQAPSIEGLRYPVSAILHALAE